MRKTIDK